jgi:hypothetical protein
MNAGLNREQIDYIKSFVNTELEYQLSEDIEGDYTDENEYLFPDNYDELSRQSDENWHKLITNKGKVVSDCREEETYRWYNIAYAVYKIGERYFEAMYVSENRSEQQEFKDIVEHYGDFRYEVVEVFRYEKTIIDYM